MLNLNFENLIYYSFKSKITAITSGSILLITLGYLLLVKPNFIQYEHLKANEPLLKHEFKIKQQQASALHAYRHQVQILHHRLDHMLQQFVRKSALPGLLEQLSKLGKSCGLSFELITPLAEIPKDFYSEIPIDMVVIGYYPQFVEFLARLAHMQKLVTVHDLIMTRASPEISHIDDALSLKLTLKINKWP